MMSFEVIRIVDGRVQSSVVRADDPQFDQWHPELRNQVCMQTYRATQDEAYDSEVPTLTRMVTAWDGLAASGASHVNRAWRRFHGMIGD